MITLLSLLALLGAVRAPLTPVVVPSQDAARSFVALDQIAWQRTLADARALSETENRPLLVVINLDGESSSDRIVSERYRNPEFVAWTRHFVCVIGHPWRHTPRDHDDLGRRIECPRLGSVTCGEHVVLEPTLFDAYLGGERISPRHALILPDGTKSFDLFLLFDMQLLDDAIAKATAFAPPDNTQQAWFNVHDEADAFLDAVAGARASWRRDAFEQGFASDSSEANAADVELAAVRAIGRVGDAGSLEFLRILLERERAPSASLLAAIEEAAASRGFTAEYAGLLREILASPGSYPGSATLGRERVLLPSLARTAGEDPSARAFVLAHAVLAGASDRDAARTALQAAFTSEEARLVEGAIANAGGPFDVEDVLRFAAEYSGGFEWRHPVPAEVERTTDDLTGELEDAERKLSRDESDPQAARGFGMANLRLARARMATSGPDIGLLLQDADTWLARAASALPDDELLAIERARTAYYLSRFDDQARIAEQLLERVQARASRSDVDDAVLARWPQWGSGSPTGRDEAERATLLASDGVALEALRWLGDAEGRRIGADANDPAALAASLLRGARALAYACASRGAGDVDYQSLASYLAAVGMTRAGLATLRAGLERFPESSVLRDMARVTLVGAGRVDVLIGWSDWLAACRPQSAACIWYAGYANYLAAEWARRGENTESALDAYSRASERFQTSASLQPHYAEVSGYYAAACELGRGFALRMEGRRQDAADALARALELLPAIGDARDGLDREALDLVDGVLEWTAEGPSRVNTTAFADQLSRAVPGETRWLLAIADSALREGLRADGRTGVRLPMPEELRVEGGPDAIDEPTELGDVWLAESIDIARRAFAVRDDATTRHYLAQTLAVQAERELVSGRASDALAHLQESAQLLEEPAQTSESVFDLARRLRERLGEARPITRPGR